MENKMPQTMENSLPQLWKIKCPFLWKTTCRLHIKIVVYNFGNILKNLRIEAGLTQKQLSERLGISKSVVSYYEKQERSPSPEVLIKLASIFRVSTDYLLGVDNVKRIDASGLSEQDLNIINLMIKSLREKNQK